MMKILKGNIFSYLTPPQLLSLAEIGAIGALSALKIANLATNEGKKFYALALASKKVLSHDIASDADHRLLQVFSNEPFLNRRASLIVNPLVPKALNEKIQKFETNFTISNLIFSLNLKNPVINSQNFNKTEKNYLIFCLIWAKIKSDNRDDIYSSLIDPFAEKIEDHKNFIKVYKEDLCEIFDDKITNISKYLFLITPNLIKYIQNLSENKIKNIEVTREVFKRIKEVPNLSSSKDEDFWNFSSLHLGLNAYDEIKYLHFLGYDTFKTILILEKNCLRVMLSNEKLKFLQKLIKF